MQSMVEIIAIVYKHEQDFYVFYCFTSISVMTLTFDIQGPATIKLTDPIYRG